MIRRLAVTTLTTFALAAGLLQPAAAQSYSFVDLGTLGGGSDTAHAVNNAGQVAGTSRRPDGTTRAWRITPDGGTWNTNPGGTTNPLMQVLALPSSATGSHGKGIDASGRVGGSVSSSKGRNAAAWNASGSAMLLSPGASYADAMSAAGDLAGTVTTRTGNYACLWQLANGKYTAVKIDNLAGYNQGFAFGVNDSRQVVGQLSSSAGERKAFLWSAATGTSILPAPAGFSVNSSRANAINGAGVIAGYASDGAVDHPVLWSGGMVTDLLPGSGFASGALYGINNATPAQAVGEGKRLDGSRTAILWNGTNVVDLADPLVTSGIPAGAALSALAINDSGHIVGFYTLGGSQRAFALIPGTP